MVPLEGGSRAHASARSRPQPGAAAGHTARLGLACPGRGREAQYWLRGFRPDPELLTLQRARQPATREMGHLRASKAKRIAESLPATAPG